MTHADHLKRDIMFRATLRGSSFTFYSTWGLFSPRHVDKGSWILVESLDLEPHHKTLDVGCGYGAIGIPVARACPQGQVHMIDKDFVALLYARRNAQANGVTNCLVYQSNGLSEVTETGFDNVVSNLPANCGGPLIRIILADSHDRLADGGRIYVVTVTHLRRFIRRNLLDIFGNYHKVKTSGTYTVAMAERMRRHRASAV